MGGTGAMGVWSDRWRKISNSGPMPACTMDGTLLMDTKMILSDFAKDYPDKTLTESEKSEVLWWVDFNKKWQDPIMEAAIHWGWSTFHGFVNDMPADRFEKAMGEYGKGKKDTAWEKNKMKEV